jgi:UDP-GlcNAc:undecaprenyl-phosphate/decaprenyl-phosphate GlcNAc-1-phosphate transferase
MNTYLFFTPIMSFVFTFLLIPVLRKAAIRVGLTDKPNNRKVHTSAVPLVGGISIFITTFVTLGLILQGHKEIIFLKNILFTSFILLTVGVIDDRFDLKASLKLVVQLLLAHFIFMQGIKIESLHGLFGIFEISEWAQYLLTIITITGVVNAFNLMDGIDGLAAGLSIIGFAVFIVLSFMTGQEILTVVFISFLGASLAFLHFNFSKTQKVFMGDAGSLMIGFIMAVSGIKLIQVVQGTAQISIVMLGVLVVMLIPVFDALRVFRKRIKAGKSPFSPDKNHLHHLLLSIGLKHKFAAFTIILLLSLHLVVGYFLYHFVGLTFSVISIIVLFNVITSFLMFNNKIITWKHRIRAMEKVQKY